MKGNVYVQSPAPSKMYAHHCDDVCNDVHNDAQIAGVEERDEVKELVHDQEAELPCTHVTPPKSNFKSTLSGEGI